MAADDGVVVAVLPDDEVELGAECLGELNATQLEATHPGGHFIGIEREEDVAKQVLSTWPFLEAVLYPERFLEL